MVVDGLKCASRIRRDILILHDRNTDGRKRGLCFLSSVTRNPTAAATRVAIVTNPFATSLTNARLPTIPSYRLPSDLPYYIILCKELNPRTS